VSNDADDDSFVMPVDGYCLRHAVAALSVQSFAIRRRTVRRSRRTESCALGAAKKRGGD